MKNSEYPNACPKCQTSLIGDLIPEDIKDHYSGSNWRREIGVEVPAIYDGIYYFECPDCQHTWGGYRALKQGCK